MDHRGLVFRVGYAILGDCQRRLDSSYREVCAVVWEGMDVWRDDWPEMRRDDDPGERWDGDRVWGESLKWKWWCGIEKRQKTGW